MNLESLLEERDKANFNLCAIDRQLREIYVKAEMAKYELEGGEIISINHTRYEVAKFEEQCLANELGTKYVYLVGRKIKLSGDVYKNLVRIYGLTGSSSNYRLIRGVK